MTTSGSFFRRRKNRVEAYYAVFIISISIIVVWNRKQKDVCNVTTYKVASSTNGHSWYYDIYVNDRLFIHQTYLPAVSGNELIQDKLTAEKLANNVIDKIENGEMPSISVSELEEMGVIDGNNRSKIR